ncbi:DUF2059 domain-containing protein [Bacteroides sp. UBA939]|uniref:DUF2059 domain-containing protein n=1 Tax=Bacteroides sp. UBA939 TaxID=1946092 RepID=UPI0025C1F932|nr:DUF2059 domain-containing protein [Bacteroides sp. UBA939]
MRKGLVLVAMCVGMLFVAAPSVSAQEVDNEYKTVLEKMLEVSGSIASAQAMVPQMIAMLKQQSPSVSTSFWDEFQKKWEAKFGSRLAELYTPIYQKYLTLDDLKGVIAFYESPVGKKLSTSTPAMMAESMQLGQQLGMEIATELQQELEARGNK